MNSKKEVEIINPKNQVNLYGYKNYFDSFKNLFEKDKLPNTILVSGPKGIGKSTFIYHFINYLLSKDEKNSYSYEDFKINQENSTFKLIQNDTHPNFFLLKNNLLNEDIKIEQTRKLLKYLNKTTYAKKLKIVLLDNAEFLNLSSSNSLLKTFEEPSVNTFFFIIHDDNTEIMDTIKSRCIEFKIHFTISDKINIFNQIIDEYDLDSDNIDLNKFFYFDTPGNFLKYFLILKESNLNISEDQLSCILYMMDIYKVKKDPNLLNYLTLFIENYYNKLAYNNIDNVNEYYNNKNKILYLITNMKKFHLDKKNLLFTIDKILKNETK